MTLKQDLQDVFTAAKAQGFILETTRGGHYKLIKGNRAIVAPSTPSDHRGLKNLISHMRSVGFEWPPPKKQSGGTSAVDVQQTYLTRVLDAAFDLHNTGKEITSLEVARLTGLKASHVSTVLNRLRVRGHLYLAGTRPSPNGGRPISVYGIRTFDKVQIEQPKTKPSQARRDWQKAIAGLAASRTSFTSRDLIAHVGAQGTDSDVVGAATALKVAAKRGIVVRGPRKGSFYTYSAPAPKKVVEASAYDAGFAAVTSKLNESTAEAPTPGTRLQEAQRLVSRQLLAEIATAKSAEDHARLHRLVSISNELARLDENA